MTEDPLRQAAQAAKTRGGLVSIDPRELERLIDEARALGDLVEDGRALLEYSSDPKRREWCERAEAVAEFFS